jgi:hypothetical protein
MVALCPSLAGLVGIDKMDFKNFLKKSEDGEGGFLSWPNFRDLSIVLVCIAVAYRLAVSKIAIDLSGFGFTDLLSLILAISAIVLSAAFYFKADESSKNFYNNSYEFTKNISELLGRIEERFGAQLLSINKGYDDLNNKFNISPVDLNKLKAEQEKEIEVIRKSEVEYQGIIDGLMEKAKMDDAQKLQMSAHMTQLKSEAENAKSELAKHTASLDDEYDFNALSLSDTLFKFFSEFSKRFFQDRTRKYSLNVIAERFDSAASSGSVAPWILAELDSIGLRKEGSLTPEGAKVLRYFVRNAPR